MGALAAFHKKHVTAERSILVGLNMDFNHLLDYATSLNLEGGAGPAMTDAKFVGGQDVRTDSLGGLAHIAIAADGGNPLASMNEATANYLLKIILGNGQSVKYGALGGKLGAALGSDGLHAVAGFNSAYIGASLIGAFISSDAATAGTNVSKVAAALRNVTVSAEEVAAVEISEMAMNPMMRLEMIGSILDTPDCSSVGAISSLLEQVSVADVQAAAKKLSNAKLSVGAHGNLANVPFADSL